VTSPTKPPTDNRLRIVLGGSWYNSTATFVRAAIHNVRTPSVRIDLIGFRLTQSGCRQPLKEQP
jgi:formylglycine-generating enzyme required for sulfatase activity